MTGHFLIEGGKIIEMSVAPYNAESELQALLADHPQLLAGDQIDPDDPCRWLLIKREVGIPDADSASDRWSVDHLFLDQYGIPTFVETKRASNTQIRREIVGQMLDYAANAVAYWPPDHIRELLMARLEMDDVDTDETLRAFLGPDVEADDYWANVRTNLQARKVRLIFVADAIPSELRRIVEFLNEQMDPAQVLAVEVKQYAGGGKQSLVPRVFGQTERAQGQKGSPRPNVWDEKSFFEHAASKVDQPVLTTLRAILELGERRGVIRWGRGATYGSFTVVDRDSGFPLFWVTSKGRMGFQPLKLAQHEVFALPDSRISLIAKFNELPGISLSERVVEQTWVEFEIAEIAQEKQTDRLLSILGEIINRLSTSRSIDATDS